MATCRRLAIPLSTSYFLVSSSAAFCSNGFLDGPADVRLNTDNGWLAVDVTMKSFGLTLYVASGPSKAARRITLTWPLTRSWVSLR
jgi:hypothetical protein